MKEFEGLVRPLTGSFTFYYIFFALKTMARPAEISSFHYLIRLLSNFNTATLKSSGSGSEERKALAEYGGGGGTQGLERQHLGFQILRVVFHLLIFIDAVLFNGKGVPGFSTSSRSSVNPLPSQTKAAQASGAERPLFPAQRESEEAPRLDGGGRIRIGAGAKFRMFTGFFGQASSAKGGIDGVGRCSLTCKMQRMTCGGVGRGAGNEESVNSNEVVLERVAVVESEWIVVVEDVVQLPGRNWCGRIR
jgi:hypothetical protein